MDHVCSIAVECLSFHHVTRRERNGPPTTTLAVLRFGATKDSRCRRGRKVTFLTPSRPQPLTTGSTKSPGPIAPSSTMFTLRIYRWNSAMWRRRQRRRRRSRTISGKHRYSGLIRCCSCRRELCSARRSDINGYEIREKPRRGLGPRL